MTRRTLFILGVLIILASVAIPFLRPGSITGSIVSVATPPPYVVPFVVNWDLRNTGYDTNPRCEVWDPRGTDAMIASFNGVTGSFTVSEPGVSYILRCFKGTQYFNDLMPSGIAPDTSDSSAGNAGGGGTSSAANNGGGSMTVGVDEFTAFGPNGERPNANGIIRLKKGDDITLKWNFPGKKCIAGEGNNDWYYGEGQNRNTSSNIRQGESGTAVLHNRQRIESFTLECHLQFSAIWQIPLISKTIILVFDNLNFAPPAANTFEIIGSNGSRMNGAGELTVPIGTDVIVQWNYPDRVCVVQRPPSPNELWSMDELSYPDEPVGAIYQESIGVRVLRGRTQNESYRIKCDKDSTFMTLNKPTPIDETRKLLIGNVVMTGGTSSTNLGPAGSSLPAGSVQGPSVCTTICGDGTVIAPEQCDDGNAINTDACSNTCTFNSSSSSSRSSSSASSASSASSVIICIPGTICPNGAACPQNGICPTSSSSSSALACIPGTICPTGDICPLNGFCPPFSSSSRSSSSSVGVCIPGTRCPNGATCPVNGTCPGVCIPGTTCPTGDVCPQNGLCPFNGSSSSAQACFPGALCPDGSICPVNGFCPEGSSSSSQGIESCTINADCPSNLCLGGFCSCTSSEQCGGNACLGGFCANIPATNDLIGLASCSTSAQCPAGMLCQGGYCSPDLALCGNGIVDAGEVCDDGNDVDIDGCTATCLLSDGAACSNPRQCRSLICKEGVCTPCVSDTECPDDMACVEGACTAVNPLDPDNDGMVVLSDGYKIAASLFSQLGSNVRPENLSYEDYLLLMQQHAAGHAPVGSTGPESVAIMAAGASAGYAWMKMRKLKKGK